MAFEIPGPPFSIEAAADLSSSQFLCIATDSNGQGAVAGAGVRITGILQNNPDAQGKAATLVDRGTSKCVAGAAIAAGAVVASNASGQVITAVAADHVVGVAAEAAGALGNIIAVRLQIGGQLNP